jgi:Na+/melibiose symporter-like transporter
MSKKTKESPLADKTEKVRYLTFGKGLMYGIGILGVQMFIGMLNSYQSQFYTSVLSANLMTCAVIILVAKIISSCSDPIIGSLIDRSHFKGGKMRPFIAMSILPFAVLTTLMFVKINFTNSVLMYVYITVTSVLWNISMSFADIPSQGLLALLSPDSDEKNMAAGISNTAKSIGIAAPTVIVPIVCMLTKSAVITEKEYLISAAVVSVLGALCTLLMLKTSKEVVKSEPHDASFKAMFTELKNNKNLLMAALVYILGFARNMGMNIAIQASAVTMHDISLKIGSLAINLAGENLSVIFGIGSGIFAGISIIVAPVINQKLGTKKTYYLFGIYGVLDCVITWVLYAFGPSLFRSMLAVIIENAFNGLMFGTHGFTPLVMVSDSCDYTEMKTGKRNEGIQYAVLSLAVKLANALSVAVGVFIVGASGYVGTMTFSQITPHTQNIVMAAYWLVPGISVGLSMIPMIFYNIDGDVKEQVKAFIASKDMKDKN